MFSKPNFHVLIYQNFCCMGLKYGRTFWKLVTKIIIIYTVIFCRACKCRYPSCKLIRPLYTFIEQCYQFAYFNEHIGISVFTGTIIEFVTNRLKHNYICYMLCHHCPKFEAPIYMFRPRHSGACSLLEFSGIYFAIYHICFQFVVYLDIHLYKRPTGVLLIIFHL